MTLPWNLIRHGFALLGLAAYAAQPSQAQPAAPDQAATPSFSEVRRLAALSAIESAVQKNYIFPALVPSIVAQLQRSQQAHRYDVDEPEVFAQRVTEDLRAASHDGHLYLKNNQAEYLAALAPAKGKNGMEAYERAEAVLDHHGLNRMEILPGNIRYLRVAAFQWVAGLTAPIYDQAVRFLEDGDAIIIDLRDNGGGESDASDCLLKAFIPSVTTLYSYNDSAPARPARAQHHLPPPRLRGKPLYILVDSHTGSAAEAFAYAVQQEKAGTIVGDTTYGAANNNKIIPIPSQFVLSVSYRRPIERTSGTNWEGVGVKPDMAVPAVRALDAAELDALQRLSAAPNASPQALARYRWASVAAQARLQPVTVAPASLLALAGTYGTTTLKDSGDGLRLSRSDRPHWPQGMRLTALTADGLFSVEAFAFDDLRVRLTGSTLEYLYGNEEDRESVARDNSAPQAQAQ